MAESKPQHISGYDADTADIIKRSCLHLVNVLGDYKDDIVIVGGMVPYMLIDQSMLLPDQKHCGSKDVDIGLDIAVLNEERYEAIAERLKSAGFAQDENQGGNLKRQTWRHKEIEKVVVDFLIDSPGKAGHIQSLTSELGAVIVPGLKLAFRDFQIITLEGKTFDGANVIRDIKICGPGAFLILKSLAFHNRSEGKDAYDIYYMVRNLSQSRREIAERIQLLLDDEKAKEGLENLGTAFVTLDSNGPVQCAKFLGQTTNLDLRADTSALIMEIVQYCRD